MIEAIKTWWKQLWCPHKLIVHHRCTSCGREINNRPEPLA